MWKIVFQSFFNEFWYWELQPSQSHLFECAPGWNTNLKNYSDSNSAVKYFTIESGWN